MRCQGQCSRPPVQSKPALVGASQLHSHSQSSVLHQQYFVYKDRTSLGSRTGVVYIRKRTGKTVLIDQPASGCRRHRNQDTRTANPQRQWKAQIRLGGTMCYPSLSMAPRAHWFCNLAVLHESPSSWPVAVAVTARTADSLVEQPSILVKRK